MEKWINCNCREQECLVNMAPRFDTFLASQGHGRNDIGDKGVIHYLRGSSR